LGVKKEKGQIGARRIPIGNKGEEGGGGQVLCAGEEEENLTGPGRAGIAVGLVRKDEAKTGGCLGGIRRTHRQKTQEPKRVVGENIRHHSNPCAGNRFLRAETLSTGRTWGGPYRLQKNGTGGCARGIAQLDARLGFAGRVCHGGRGGLELSLEYSGN